MICNMFSTYVILLIANVENITCPIFASELHCIYFMIWLFFSCDKYKNILLDNFDLIWTFDHYIKPRGTISLRIDQNNCFWPRPFCIQAMQLELYDPHREHICTDSSAIIFIKSQFHGIIIKLKIEYPINWYKMFIHSFYNDILYKKFHDAVFQKNYVSISIP